jgi:hypothetical protein
MGNRTVIRAAGRSLNQDGSSLTIRSDWLTRLAELRFTLTRLVGYCLAVVGAFTAMRCVWAGDLSPLAGRDLGGFQLQGGLVSGAAQVVLLLGLGYLLFVLGLLALVSLFALVDGAASEWRVHVIDLERRTYTRDGRIFFTIPAGAEVSLDYPLDVPVCTVRLSVVAPDGERGQVALAELRGYGSSGTELGLVIAALLDVPLHGPRSFLNQAERKGVRGAFRVFRVAVFILAALTGVMAIARICGVPLNWLWIWF